MTAADLRRSLARLDKVPEEGIKLAAIAVERIAAAEGGTVVLGKKRRRVKLTAVSRVTVKGDNVSVTVWGKPTGPWVWKNTGASSHSIPKRKPTAKKPRPMKGRGYEHPIERMQIHHPGTHGRGAWRNVQKQAGRVIPELFRDEVRKAVSSRG